MSKKIETNQNNSNNTNEQNNNNNDFQESVNNHSMKLKIISKNQ